MLLRPLVACLAFAASAAAHAECADSIAQLRGLLADSAFPLRWEETGTEDGRPLLVSLDERGGGLFISFAKTGEGILAEGPARVCRDEHRLQARFARGELQLGPAASWLLKTALRAGAAVSLQRTGPAQLRIVTPGWNGEFVPLSRSVGLKTSFGAF